MPANWSRIAENIYLPFDEARRYHPEFEGFEPGTVVPGLGRIVALYHCASTLYRNS